MKEAMKRGRNEGIWDFEQGIISQGGVQDLILGLDGGTTSTVCICMPVFSFTDECLPPDPPPVLAHAVAGCSNHNSVGETAAKETLENVMADALFKSGSTRSSVRAVCLAVSGVNHPTDQERILSWLREIFPNDDVKCFVHNDAVAAMASGTMGKLHGCVLIAGTGTIAYGYTEDGREARASGAGPVLGDWGREIFPNDDVKCFVHNDAVAAMASGTMGKLHGCVLIAGTGTIAYGYTEDGREARASGAGPVLGDWGSGYGIAAMALTSVIRAYDGRGPQTMLTSRILHELELSSPDELIGWTYSDPSWARIAALVSVVVSCAEAGDEVANGILLDAVQELASSVKAVVCRLGLCGEDGKGSCPLVMVGGVLQANRKWDIGKEVISCVGVWY